MLTFALLNSIFLVSLVTYLFFFFKYAFKNIYKNSVVVQMTNTHIKLPTITLYAVHSVKSPGSAAVVSVVAGG